MPNDAKLGLVLGVGLVIAVGVVFFRRDLATAQPNDNPAGAVSSPAGPPDADPPGKAQGPVEGRTARTALGL
jgi:hypothetical protein